MNWLSKILGNLRSDNLGKTTINSVVETIPSDEEPNILKELFVDETPPESEKEGLSTSENSLKQFLDKDYSSQGFEDGNHYPSFDIFENKKRKIRAEFRYVIDIEIDKKNTEIFILKNHLVATDGISTSTYRQVSIRIEELEARINELETQKELSADDEGLVMVPIHNYCDGFVRGVESYRAEKLLASSTGLFA